MRCQGPGLGWVHAFGQHQAFGFLAASAKHQGLGLGQTIGEQKIMVAGKILVRARRDDEIYRDDVDSLMQELKKRVLTVGPAAEHNWSGLRSHRRAVHHHALAVALHVELLHMRWKKSQAVIIRKDCECRSVLEIGMPYADHGQQHRQILIQRRGLEVPIHGLSASQHLIKGLKSPRKNRRQTDRRPKRIPPSDPVPNREHTLLGNSEGHGFIGRRRHGRHMR